jgi:hypothetical protein
MLDLAVDYIKDLQKQVKVTTHTDKHRHSSKTTVPFSQDLTVT